MGSAKTLSGWRTMFCLALVGPATGLHKYARLILKKDFVDIVTVRTSCQLLIGDFFNQFKEADLSI